jgi:tripartite-type tricarboxylate transporter receptor subunit TctC
MKLHIAVAAAAALSVLTFGARAEGFPDKPITIVAPFPAGSTSDLIPRLVAPIVSKQLGVPVIVENRAGANGSVGAGVVARAPADGQTILLGTTGVLAINQWIYANPQYLPERDFAPIIDAAATPNLLVVNPKIKANTLKELVEEAKAHPGQLSFASAGNGSTSHMCGEALKHAAGVNLVHVPYKGPAPAAQDLLSGRVSMMCDNLSNVLHYVQNGQLKAIALTDTKRSPQLPNVPTTAEAGYPQVQAGIWYGFVAPAKTPKAVIDKLNAAFAKALHDPAVVARLDGLGLKPIADKPEAFKSFIASEAARMKDVVAASGARID